MEEAAACCVSPPLLIRLTVTRGSFQTVMLQLLGVAAFSLTRSSTLAGAAPVAISADWLKLGLC